MKVGDFLADCAESEGIEAAAEFRRNPPIVIAGLSARRGKYVHLELSARVCIDDRAAGVEFLQPNVR